jgi:hypothetical protein
VRVPFTFRGPNLGGFLQEANGRRGQDQGQDGDLLNAAKPQPSLLPIARHPTPFARPGPAAMTSTVKALFALATVAAVSIGLLLPVPGAGHQNLDARGRYETMDVGR